jgi:hypothetical protein
VWLTGIHTDEFEAAAEIDLDQFPLNTGIRLLQFVFTFPTSSPKLDIFF